MWLDGVAESQIHPFIGHHRRIVEEAELELPSRGRAGIRTEQSAQRPDRHQANRQCDFTTESRTVDECKTAHSSR